MQSEFRLNKLQVLTLVALLFATAFAMAQGIVTGTISGTVEDAQGAVVSGANIIARDVATNRELTGQTNDSGIFIMRGVPPGTYNVTIEAANFRKYENKAVTVEVGSETAIGRIRMEVGSGSETITVEGTAPLVQSEASVAGEVFTTKQAADLPVGNGFDMLALFTPGVVDSGSNGFSNSNGASLNVNGQRGRSNNFQLDGQQNNDNSVAGPAIFFGNADAIAEVQVLTNYSAEYGRNTGSVINYITKGGTNAFHGTAYEVYDGSWADSFSNDEKNPVAGFCTPGENPNDGCTPPVLPRYVDNRFGGTIGGPIKKDKMWFFGSGNIERQRIGSSSNPSGGLFTPSPTGLQELQAAFPGNAGVAALTAIGPLSVKKGVLQFSDFTPVTVTDGVTSADVEFAKVNRQLDSIFNDWEATGRYDWQITSKDRFFARYIFQQQINTNVTVASQAENASGNFVDVPARAQSIGLDWSRTFSPLFLNQVRFSYGRTNVGFEGGGFPDCTRASLPNGCPTRIVFADGTDMNAGVQNNFPQGRRVLVYTLQDNASYQMGRHLLKFGGDYTREDSPNVFLPTLDGQFTFPADPDPVTGQPIPFSGFNHLLSNTPSQTLLGDGSPNIPFKENDLSFYFQDEWRVKDNLTLTLGMRWEWDQQALNLIHDQTVAQQTGPNPFWDPSLPLSLTTTPHLPQDLNNFSPIIGFAWTPRMAKRMFGEDKTVIRGGFRISYDPAFYNINLNVATSTPSVNLGNIPSCPGCLPASGSAVDARANVLPFIPTGAGINPGTRTQSQVSRNFHNPYSIQWNFGVQRELFAHSVLEVKYVGNHGIGQFQGVNGNPAIQSLINEGFSNFVPAGFEPCTTPGAPGNFANRGYVDCNHRNVTIRQNSAYNIYHSLQSRFETRSFHGITTGLTYTWSKNIDNTSEIFSTLSGGNTVSFAQNPFDVSKAERALSGIDFPHVANLYMLYEVPWYRSQKGFVGKLLGGYQINPTWRYQSGQPWTPAQTRFDGPGSGVCDGSGTFSGTFSPCRPFVSNPAAPVDMTGQCLDPTCAGDSFVDFNTGAPISPSAVRWIINDFNSATFFGTPYSPVRRNIVRGQTINNASLAVIKNTKFGERVSLELRAVAFNVLNRQFRGVPDPVLLDGNAEVGSSFGNTNFNPSGGDSTNVTQAGIGRRRIELGAKIIF